MDLYYPPVGFHFKVEVKDIAPNAGDVRFTEVSGLAMELAGEEVPEGGENRFVQRYPTRRKHPELVLKRGLMVDSAILGWIQRCLTSLPIEPKDVDVTLLNDRGEPLMTWHLVRAYPTKWSVSDFNAANSAVVVETLQLFYQTFTVRGP